MLPTAALILKDWQWIIQTRAQGLKLWCFKILFQYLGKSRLRFPRHLKEKNVKVKEQGMFV